MKNLLNILVICCCLSFFACSDTKEEGENWLRKNKWEETTYTKITFPNVRDTEFYTVPQSGGDFTFVSTKENLIPKYSIFSSYDVLPVDYIANDFTKIESKGMAAHITFMPNDTVTRFCFIEFPFHDMLFFVQEGVEK
ncbi:MAG: hypothetical protein Q4B68_08200 [Bacteroidales bacterium]|nr:hypothetical protein [Bacteroidales bacterium]